MKLTQAQKRLLIDVHVDMVRHDTSSSVCTDYRPAVFLVEHGLASWGGGRDTYKPLVLTEEGAALAITLEKE